jgi:hypothetical protein
MSLAGVSDTTNVNSVLYRRYQDSEALLQWQTKQIQEALKITDLEFVTALFLTSVSADDLEWKLHHLGPIRRAVDRSTGKKRLEEMASYIKTTPVDPVAIGRGAAFVVMTSWWYDFLTPQYLDLRKEEEVRRGGVRSKAVERLKTALDMVTLTMAQQLTVSGDMLVALSYSKLSGEAKPRYLSETNDANTWWSAKAANDIRNWIALNPLFARNFGLYFVRKKLQELGHSFASYEVAYAASEDPTWMDRVIGRSVLVRPTAEGSWTAQLNGLNGVKFSLPKPEDVVDGRFLQPRSFADLSTVRN